ncbi:unnamed protein product [Sphagnum balticum]
MIDIDGKLAIAKVAGDKISAEVKFCDMRVDMREYALLITEYIYVQMVKNEVAYLKDAAEYIKKGFE